MDEAAVVVVPQGRAVPTVDSVRAKVDPSLVPVEKLPVFKNRWKPIRKIGQGAFGQIYEGIDLQTRELVAIKTELSDAKRQVLKLEVSILNKLQECSYVCRLIHCGRTKEYNFMIMELLGENLNELRKRRPDQRFSLPTAITLAIHMIRAIEGIHALGFLHRDVKSSNFAMGNRLNPETARRCFVLDFGLARRFRETTGEVRAPRETVGFRGTARYASINSHLSKELSPRDDLWSVLYVLVEFCVGRLPWSRTREKEVIGEMKMKYNSFELVRDLPVQVWQVMLLIKSLEYGDTPKYSAIIHLLESVFDSVHVDRNLPFDWEFEEEYRMYGLGKAMVEESSSRHSDPSPIGGGSAHSPSLSSTSSFAYMRTGSVSSSRASGMPWNTIEGDGGDDDRFGPMNRKKLVRRMTIDDVERRDRHRPFSSVLSSSNPIVVLPDQDDTGVNPTNSTDDMLDDVYAMRRRTWQPRGFANGHVSNPSTAARYGFLGMKGGSRGTVSGALLGVVKPGRSRIVADGDELERVVRQEEKVNEEIIPEDTAVGQPRPASPVSLVQRKPSKAEDQQRIAVKKTIVMKKPKRVASDPSVSSRGSRQGISLHSRKASEHSVRSQHSRSGAGVKDEMSEPTDASQKQRLKKKGCRPLKEAEESVQGCHDGRTRPVSKAIEQLKSANDAVYERVGGESDDDLKVRMPDTSGILPELRKTQRMRFTLRSRRRRRHRRQKNDIELASEDEMAPMGQHKRASVHSHHFRCNIL